MGNSLDPGDRAEHAASQEPGAPPGPVAETVVPRGGRDRASRAALVRAALVRAPPSEGKGGTDAAPSRDIRMGLAQAGVSRAIARQALAGSADRLLAEARTACLRDGVAATRRHMLMRVAKGVGLSQVEVARGLRGAIGRGGRAAASAAVGAWYRHDPIALLAATILGAREREVFLTRRDTRAEDVAVVHELAGRLGVSAERVYELEASARRKLTRALG